MAGFKIVANLLLAKLFFELCSPDMTHRFIADVHLGKLARLLRLLGFDTNYKNDYSNSEVLQLSR